MATVVLLTMAHTTTTTSKTTTNDNDVKNPTIFHDFLGSDSPSKAPAADVRPASPPASASLGGSSAGGRGPISTTSDLGSERQVGHHFEGVPYYGPRSDLSGPEIGNKFAGSKRSNSDSAFIVSSRDRFPQMRPESLESSHLMKMIRSAGGDRPRRPHEEETVFGMHQMRPTSASLILQPAPSGRTDANASKWDRAIPMNVGPVVQYPPRAGQVVPFGYQAPSNRFRDTNAGPSVVSQAAADEGSRTGIKGSGILSSVNAGSGIADRNLPSGGGKLKTGARISEPESSTPPSRPGLTSSSRQMTIFYGGQAHVFDDVPPNKADVIMALAGSNGGSWSTTYMPKSGVRSPPGENYVQSRDNETSIAGNSALPREFRGRLSVAGNSSHGFGSGDRISIPPVHQGGIVMKDARGLTQLAEPAAEEKREV
ncbi:hypothetical protein LguiB_012089 [Lonicera macranthoides]